MRYSVAVAVAAFLAQASAHGVITEIQGANGVNMPGLSVADGTPRDCPTPGCGAEADTSIIRDNELGTQKATALGRTNGGGPVNAASAIQMFMTGSSANSSTTTAAKPAKRQLSSLLGGGATGGGATGASGASADSSSGTQTAAGTKESGVSAAAGTGSKSGLPTVADDGTVTMTFHQVNQDGAGPLTASVDSTSGGTDPTAFKDAQVTQNVAGLGFGGLSLAQTTDFPVKAQIPQGTTCDGQAGGASNVCVLRLQNSAAAGPFGGSVAFTQTAKQRKRAIEYRLKARGLHVARGLVGKADLE